MSENISRGYRSLSPDALREVLVEASLPGSIAIPMNSEQEIVPEDWQAGNPVNIRARVTLDVDKARSDTGLRTLSSLSLAVIWQSEKTRLTGALPLVRLDAEGKADLRGSVPGNSIGTSVKLLVQIVLAQDAQDEPPVTVAQHAGDILWETRRTIRLEGTAPRLPVVMIPFSEHAQQPLGGRGMWSLEVRTEFGFDAPVQSSLWLWLNSENSAVKDMLAAPDQPKSQVMRSMLSLDIQRRLIDTALNEAEFAHAGNTFPAGSLGEALQAAVVALGQDLAELRGLNSQELDLSIQTQWGVAQ